MGWALSTSVVSSATSLRRSWFGSDTTSLLLRWFSCRISRVGSYPASRTSWSALSFLSFPAMPTLPTHARACASSPCPWSPTHLVSSPPSSLNLSHSPSPNLSHSPSLSISVTHPLCQSLSIHLPLHLCRSISLCQSRTVHLLRSIHWCRSGWAFVRLVAAVAARGACVDVVLVG